MDHLSRDFWTDRYLSENTGWDLGDVSPPIKEYFDKISEKSIKILIPGCGNAYEAEYLFRSGFKNVHIIDLSDIPLKAFLKRVEGFPENHVHQGDFFEHVGQYDFIVEQTMFCAIDPDLRMKYAKKVHELLVPKGRLIGVLFNTEFEGGPPYGGSKEEYMRYFGNYFKQIKMDECYNSIAPRMGRELFINIQKD